MLMTPQEINAFACIVAEYLVEYSGVELKYLAQFTQMLYNAIRSYII